MVLKRDIKKSVQEKEEVDVSARFMRELKILQKFAKQGSEADMGHFSVLMGVLLEKEALVLVMPYYRFGNLKAYLMRLRIVESKQMLLWVQQLWSIGSHLRRMRVGHRNIEPSNICLTRESGRELFKLVLVDWKCAVETASADLKKNGHLVRGFNMEYQPPEVVFDYGVPCPHNQDE